jgi:AcrR family transcriptional regulator
MDGTNIVRRPPFGSNPAVGERGSDTQRRILEAALAVFGEVGFHDGRVELITERAGCSRPAFYQYFSSKDDVFWTLARRLGHAMVDLGAQLGAVTPDVAGVAEVRAWLGAFAELYDDHAPVFTAFQAAIRDHEPLARGSSSISDRLGDALLKGAAGSSEPATHHLATGVVAVLVRVNFFRHSDPTALDIDRFVDSLSVIVHRLLAGPIDGVNIRPTGARPPRRRAPLSAVPAVEPGRELRPRGRRTRQQLLDAGAAVLPARGYHETRVDDIVAAAGVSHGSFYRYFSSKDDFFHVLAEGASTRMLELIDAFPGAAEPVELRAWLETWFDAYESNGGVISTWQEMQTSDPRLRAFSRQIAATVLDRLTLILAPRGFGDPLVDALTLLAVIERLPYSVYTLHHAERDEAVDAMAVIIRRGLMGLP